MGKANYRQIGGPDGLLANCKSFDGNTMWAAVSMDSVSGHTIYNVYSYHTLIARMDLATGQRYIPDTHYSVTTTRQQNLCRAWMGSTFTPLFESE